MSRRKVSVKELDQVDFQGWLYRKKEGKGLLRSKWKKCWFVLQRTSLYWYSWQMAEKADGYINLADFTIDQATECRKKHAMKASHPRFDTLFLAADTLPEMNEWLVKLSAVATQSSERNSGEGYSEESDQEQEESEAALGQLTTDSLDGAVPPPRSTSSPRRTAVPTIAPASIVTSESSEALAAERTETPSPGGVGGAKKMLPQERICDEMERLYIHLRQMRFSPMGQIQPPRASFLQRCSNHNMNDKLHLLRTLNSTLKSKEADLLTLEQVLEDPTLTARKYRRWKACNVLLMQEITKRKAPGGGSREPPVRPPKPARVAETRV